MQRYHTLCDIRTRSWSIWLEELYTVLGEKPAAGFVDLSYNYLQEKLQELFSSGLIEKLQAKQKPSEKVLPAILRLICVLMELQILRWDFSWGKKFLKTNIIMPVSFLAGNAIIIFTYFKRGKSTFLLFSVFLATGNSRAHGEPVWTAWRGRAGEFQAT